MSIPWLGCSFTTVNVRAVDAPIFKPCYGWDLDTVRFLLETKQASIYDVDAEFRCGLLEVRIAPARGFYFGISCSEISFTEFDHVACS
jgi:hypothetical protein